MNAHVVIKTATPISAIINNPISKWQIATPVCPNKRSGLRPNIFTAPILQNEAKKLTAAIKYVPYRGLN